MNIINGLYVAEIPPQPYNSAVNYKIYAYDWASNLAISKTYSYVVIDPYPPIISYVDRVPASPNYNENVTVFANVTEPPEASGVKNVTLWYKTDSEEWQPVAMTLDKLYTGIIPAFPYGTVVQYRVRAFDYAGNLATSGVYSYTVVAPPMLPPVAKFTESAETVYTGEVITFNATSSYDPDGTIASYFWYFGDGTNATGVIVNHAYSTEGKYIVNLTVTDDDGLTGTFISIKTVLNRPPIAYFTENATTVLTRETIHFNASGSYDPDGHIIAYIWNFSDGASASGVSVNHTYEDAGTYEVTLTVIDNDGATSSYSAVETVLNKPPFANFSWSPHVAVVNKVVTFNASASYDLYGTIISYHWNFGDNNITTVNNPIINHTYTKKGNYTVTLTVTDNHGAVSSVSAVVTVKALAGSPLALVAAICLGVAALTATLLYALYRSRKKGKSAANPGNTVQPKPVVTLYVPANILS
jgi:PKD repeat protein